MIAAALRPLYREAAIAFYRWALHDMDPLHSDLPYVVHRLRDLLAERYAAGCYLRRTLQWL